MMKVFDRRASQSVPCPFRRDDAFGSGHRPAVLRFIHIAFLAELRSLIAG